MFISMTKCAQVLTKICQMLSQVILLKMINFVALNLAINIYIVNQMMLYIKIYTEKLVPQNQNH